MKLKQECITFKMDIGRGIFFLSTLGALSKKLLALMPYST